MVHQQLLSFITQGRKTHDITDQVREVVTQSGIQVGMAHIFVQHTSCSLLLTENADPDVHRDLETLFGRIAPDGDSAYRHDLEGPDDMPAHARSVLAGSSLSIPVGGGRLLLGVWQGVYLWEHRHRSHQRRVMVTVMG